MEGQFLLFAQEHLRTPWLTPLMLFVSFLGDGGWVWITSGVLMLIFRKTRKAGLCVLMSLLLGFLVNNLFIKNLVARVRPYDVIPGLEALTPPLKDWSFPSGHACSSFAAATAMTLSLGKKVAWIFILAALIALSRVYIGVHYPSDILTGAAVGALMALCAWYGMRQWKCGNKGRAGHRAP